MMMRMASKPLISLMQHILKCTRGVDLTLVLVLYAFRSMIILDQQNML